MSLIEPIAGPSVLFSFGIALASLDPISLVLSDFQYRYRTSKWQAVPPARNSIALVMEVSFTTQLKSFQRNRIHRQFHSKVR